MTDEEYIYNTEVRDRKRTARGAFARRCGSKSKKCTLPSDYLTPSQKRKLNGEEHTMSLRNPTTFKEFKKLPQNMQQEYLQYLCDNYDARIVDIMDMMHISYSTYSRLVATFATPVIPAKKSKTPSKKWLSFIEKTTQPYVKNEEIPMSIQDTQELVTIEEPTDIKETNTKEAIIFNKQNIPDISGATINFKNTSLYDVAMFLLKSFDYEAKSDISISITAIPQ